VHAADRYRRALAAASGDVRVMVSAHIGLGLVELAAGRAEAAGEQLQRAVRLAHQAGELDLDTLAQLHTARLAGLTGRPGPSLRIAREAVGFARALALPALECASMEVMGQQLLDLELAEDAALVLADISALSHATDLVSERWRAHALRAQAALDRQPASREGAAAAVERLLRIFSEPVVPDAEGHRVLAQALLARASARLSNGQGYRVAARRAEQALGAAQGPSLPLGLRTRLQLVCAHAGFGQLEPARQQARIAAEAARGAGFTFLAWRAARLQAALDGEELPPPMEILEGLEPRFVAPLSRKPLLG